jgi:hypothetical protein
MHIAMWSGPRNLSTAMMYSFGARTDFDVRDEPFYGAFLKATGIQHPMSDEIIESMACEPEDVLADMHAYDTPHLYSKQMTHHMLPEMPRDWFSEARHVFLIRHPARVVASYLAKRESPCLQDLGFHQQEEIFRQTLDLGQTPIVVDSFDIRAAPVRTLAGLCQKLGLVWDPAMLSWSRGGHAKDGVWANHWYGAVHESTGFDTPEGPLPDLTGAAQDLVNAAMPIYERMRAFV